MIEQFLQRLKGVRHTGKEWMALCPAHPDRIPSLSVGLGADNRILLHCHRGCDTPAILQAIGVSPADLFPDSDHSKPSGTSKAGSAVNQTAYDYTDEKGALLYRVIRAPGKRFSQCRPDGQGGWIWKLGDTRRVLYRLPDLRNAIAEGRTVFVAEGEKDVESLRGIGLAATCNSGGAGKWPAECSKLLAGANVVILPDNDAPGRAHARSVAGSLADVAAEVRILELPGLPEKGDVSEWLRLGEGKGAETLQALADSAPLFNDERVRSTDPQPDGKAEPSTAPTAACSPTGSPTGSSSSSESHGRRPPSSAVLLTRIGRKAELFHNDRGEAFARFTVDDHREIRALDSRGFRNWLSFSYLSEQGKPPAPDAIATAVGALTGVAEYQSPQHTLHVRVAPGTEESVWYDLVDKEWKAVHITAQGWQIDDHPPILFQRYSHLAPHVVPDHGGSLDELRSFLNLKEDSDWYLLVAWLAAALLPNIGHPVLVIHGEQGSSKSTTARLLGQLIDPSLVALRAEPRELAEWIQAADHSWLISLDNVSRIPIWLSDALCRAVTGEAFIKRTLYTNDEDSLTRFQRVVILTGIETVVQRPDLLDRSILLGLEPIFPTKRKSERVLLQAFEEARPRIFGALLTLVSGVLAALPEIQSEGLPRLADFARVGLAVERVCGWPADTFKNASNRNDGVQDEEAIAGSPIGEALIEFTDSFRNYVAGAKYWDGTVGELLAELNCRLSHARPLDWPRDPRSLGAQLRRLAPSLRAVGITFEYFRRANMRRIRVFQWLPEKTEPKTENVVPS